MARAGQACSRGSLYAHSFSLFCSLFTYFSPPETQSPWAVVARPACTACRGQNESFSPSTHVAAASLAPVWAELHTTPPAFLTALLQPLIHPQSPAPRPPTGDLPAHLQWTSLQQFLREGHTSCGPKTACSVCSPAPVLPTVLSTQSNPPPDLAHIQPSSEQS